jgi:8-oxo-dGTP diphosphatase
LLQVREPDAAIRDALTTRLLAEARIVGARVLVNGTVDDARRLGCDGVHWTARALRAATSRPRDLVVGASCHTRAEIAHAGALDVDFVVLGPVFATPTHPDARPLGWQGFAAAIEGTRIPVFALGGIQPLDLDTAIAHGAHGIAMRRHAWSGG